MKIAIYGYGNLGRGVECAIRQNDDMELFGVFTRRDPATLKTLTGAAVFAAAPCGNIQRDRFVRHPREHPHTLRRR